MPGPVIVPILGDQLNRQIASIRGCAKDDTVILMMEVWDEATYVKHHKQKIALIFSAMRHFATAWQSSGFRQTCSGGHIGARHRRANSDACALQLLLQHTDKFKPCVHGIDKALCHT